MVYGRFLIMLKELWKKREDRYHEILNNLGKILEVEFSGSIQTCSSGSSEKKAPVVMDRGYSTKCG